MKTKLSKEKYNLIQSTGFFIIVACVMYLPLVFVHEEIHIVQISTRDTCYITDIQIFTPKCFESGRFGYVQYDFNHTKYSYDDMNTMGEFDELEAYGVCLFLQILFGFGFFLCFYSFISRERKI